VGFAALLGIKGGGDGGKALYKIYY
jgi:hypothetical protein